MHDENGGNKIVNLSDARKNAGKSRKGAASGKANGSKAAYEKALKTQKGGAGNSTGQIKWYHYAQTIGLLLLVAWLMKSCQS